MSLPDTVRDRLYAAALEAFHILVPSCHFNVGVDLVNAIVVAARSSVAHEFNLKRPDKISRLPVELRATCFKYLTLRSRLSVSHVCRSWRDAALSDPSLWNKMCEEDPQSVELLATIFARSKSTVVRIHWCRPASEAVISLISNHACRISELVMLNGKYNVLNAFVSTNSVLSSPAPRPHCIESLSIGLISIPVVFEPIPTLRRLRCDKPLDLLKLFQIFPLIEDLELRGFNDESLLPLKLVPSLKRLVIAGVDMINVGPFFTEWHASQYLQTIRVDFPIEIDAIMTFFLQSIQDDGWHMSLSHNFPSIDIAISHSTIKIFTRLLESPGQAMIMEAAHRGRFDRLVALSVTADLLLTLSENDLSLPSVIALSVTVRNEVEDIDGLSEQMETGASLRVPKLEGLKIAYEDITIAQRWTSSADQSRFSGITDFDAESLKQFIIASPHVQQLASVDWSRIFRFSEEFLLWDSSDDVVDVRARHTSD